MSYLADVAWDWGVRAFGLAHLLNIPLRSLRVAEEAIELAQSYGVPKELLLKQVEEVYARPKGIPMQELGGVALSYTLLLKAVNCGGVDHHLTNELKRVLAKPIEHFTARNQHKLDIGLDIQ